MTPAQVLKLVLDEGHWPRMRATNYPGWLLMRELGTEAREFVLEDGGVLFVDGAFLYHCGESGDVLGCYRLEQLEAPKSRSGINVGCERPDGTLNIHPVEETCEECK